MREKKGGGEVTDAGVPAARVKMLALARVLLAASTLAPACAGGTTPTVPNVPPSAAFVYNPVSPIVAGETTVTLDASASQDSDGRIVSYTWIFGDGSASQTVATPVVTHVFPDTRITCDQVIYAVQLTVTDDKGDRDSTTDQVTVTELPDPRVVDCVPG